MRKFSKLLASLLVVMLLLGAVAVSVFAATDKENQLYLSGDGIVAGLNHSGGKTGSDFQDGKAIGSDAVTATSSSNKRGGLANWGATYNGGTNKYARIYNDGTATTLAASIYWDWYGDRGKYDRSRI